MNEKMLTLATAAALSFGVIAQAQVQGGGDQPIFDGTVLFGVDQSSYGLMPIGSSALSLEYFGPGTTPTTMPYGPVPNDHEASADVFIGLGGTNILGLDESAAGVHRQDNKDGMSGGYSDLEPIITDINGGFHVANLGFVETLEGMFLNGQAEWGFSVDHAAVGQAGTGINTRYSVPTDGTEGAIYATSSVPTTSPTIGSNNLVILPASLGLKDLGDNVDALHGMDVVGNTYGVDPSIAPGDPGAINNPNDIFFTLKSYESPTLGLTGNDGSDIFTVVGGAPAVWADNITLGLTANDDIDALVVFDRWFNQVPEMNTGSNLTTPQLDRLQNDPTNTFFNDPFFYSTLDFADDSDLVVFSLTEGSQSLFKYGLVDIFGDGSVVRYLSPGDLFISDGDGFFALYKPAELLGLEPYDNLDALTLVAIPEPASIALLGLGGLLVASRRRR